MSDKPLLADERPIPAREKVRPVNKTSTRMNNRPIHNPDRAKKRKRNGIKMISVRLQSSDYARLKNAVKSNLKMTLQRFCEGAILKEVSRIEKKRGRPFPPSSRTTSKVNQRKLSKHAVDVYR